MSAHASTLVKFALRTFVVHVLLSIPKIVKTQNGSDKERLRCFAFSVKMQANNECDNLKNLEIITLVYRYARSSRPTMEEKLTVHKFIV